MARGSSKRAGGRSHLRFVGIRPATWAKYVAVFLEFWGWLRASARKIPGSLSGLDRAGAVFMNHMYQQGDTLTRGGHFISALVRLYPPAKGALPTTRCWFRNWQSGVVPQRALPMPWHLVRGLAGVALAMGRPDLTVVLII